MKTLAITFNPSCPDCGHEMMDVYGKWECLNPECGTIELKAQNDLRRRHSESVVDRTAVIDGQDKQPSTRVKQKGVSAEL